LINAKSINENKFKECLMSLKKQNYEQIDQIIIINF
jgi:cellulose synthase/poly-beta-1,6-N-acetylglucosamine synthase-like glycosyltransferase